MAEQQTHEYYTTMAVSKLFENEDLRQEFMNIYGQDIAAAKDFLVHRLGMPEEMAEPIASKRGDDLSMFVGQNVCSYLW